ncbi:MAG: DUF4293 domain-containing protein [Saprospiraceae bacterium]|nr:DUF4293 domain-containing protein [Saprospiraceae bacterium]
MIQRLQSIFLLLSGICFFSLFGVPFATSSVAIPNLLSDMVYNIQDNVILMILCGLGGLVSIVAIFLYNNRAFQIKLSYLATVFAILLPVVAILLIYNEGTATTQADKIQDKFGIYLPIVSLVFSVLATRFINKDESTVRSMDRLR